MRESPAIKLIHLLQNAGADVSYHDPHVPQLPKMRKHDLRLVSQALTEEYLAGQDCVLIVTDHTAVDWNTVFKHSRLVVDPRNALGKIPGNHEHVIR
jgi:UDP-N-acetyl-D-glucosamine dehydrogenase